MMGVLHYSTCRMFMNLGWNVKEKTAVVVLTVVGQSCRAQNEKSDANQGQ